MHLPDARADAALAAIYRGEAPPAPTLYAGLSTTIPQLAGDGSGYLNVTEPTAASYARVPVDPSEWAVQDRIAEVLVDFPAATEDLGVAVAWVLFDTEAPGTGTATDAGRVPESMSLEPGTSDITVTCRVVAPTSLTA